MEKSGILAQSTTLIDRIKQHRWTIGVAGAASALGMAGAIAVAPADGLPGTRMVVEQLALESAKPVVGSDHVFLREEKIQRGDTVAALLNRLGIQEGEALYFVRTSAQTQALYQQLVPGKVVVAQTTASGDLVALHFPLNGGESALSVERVGGALSAKTVPLRFETHTVMKTAEIRSSLFAATVAVLATFVPAAAQTVGDAAKRPGHMNATWGYWTSDGLGFHELLQWCEDLGAEPLYVLNCGMSHKELVPTDELGPWVQEALDAIEYANGPQDSPFGMRRADNGHPAPFGLKYIEIGNENGMFGDGPGAFGGSRTQYAERYRLFRDAIHARYPDIQIIANTRIDAPADIKCPDCEGPMKLRPGRWGKYFFGCNNYPKCKGTRQAPPELIELLQNRAVTPA